MRARRTALALAFALAGCAVQPAGDAASSAAPIGIPLEVLRPAGTGPFPAIVMLHDCSGLGPRSSGSPRRWARRLLDQGYVVALPDSFSTRGFVNGVCSDPDRHRVGPFRRLRDAYATLRYLRTLSFVDGKRIGVMGGSHGGATTVASVAANAAGQPQEGGFAAAVALYPACAIGEPRFNTRYRAAAPLLILAGALDDWTPAQACRELAAVADPTGARVTLKVYPGAHHAFDSNAPLRYVPMRMNANAPGGRGATTAGNAEAWADSIREVSAFLRREL